MAVGNRHSRRHSGRAAAPWPFSRLRSYTEQANASLGVRLIAGVLLGLLLVLDSFVIYQQVYNNHIRRQVSEELAISRLIRENAADMIAVVDTNGRPGFITAPRTRGFLAIRQWSSKARIRSSRFILTTANW